MYYTTFASTCDNIGIVAHITDFNDVSDVREQLNHYRWNCQIVKESSEEVVAIIYLRVGIGKNFQSISKKLGCIVQVNTYTVVYGLGTVTTYKNGSIINYYVDFDERYEWWLTWGDMDTLMGFGFIELDEGDSPFALNDNELVGYEFSDDEVSAYIDRLNSGYNCGF